MSVEQANEKARRKIMQKDWVLPRSRNVGRDAEPARSGIVRKHVVVVDDIPTPYRIALFKAIQSLAPFRFSVVWLAARGREKLWKLDVQGSGLEAYSAKDWQVFIPAADRRITISRNIVRMVKRLRPDVVVTGGYHQTGYWQCLYYAMTRGRPLICWSGATPGNERSDRRVIHALKRFYIRRCAYLIAYGSEAAELFRMRGGDPARIHKVFNTTDLRAVRSATAEFSVCDAERAGPVRILSVGRLMRDKGIQSLLEPLARLKGEFEFQVRLVGDGPYRDELNSLVQAMNLSDRVVFTGYVQQDQLAQHLAWADVFVFPSTYDVWGIVVNEALAGGLYVMSSVLAGATVDLIDPEISGTPFDPKSPESVYDALRDTLEKIDWIRVTREKRAKWVMQFDALESAKEFVRICELALGNSGVDSARLGSTSEME